MMQNFNSKANGESLDPFGALSLSAFIQTLVYYLSFMTNGQLLSFGSQEGPGGQ
jgi:hypothetical protein